MVSPRLMVVFLLLSQAFSFSIPFSKIAVLKIHGEIGRDVRASEIIEALEKIDKDPFYSAVVLDIDSGGGSAVESHEIVRELDRMKKPKVARIGNVGASGAYWIASACDFIIADELSIVGSIGAASFFYSPRDLARKLGIEVYEVAYPENKSFGSAFFNESFLPYANAMVKSAAEFFMRDIERRKPKAERYLTGLPYLAKDAPELVDGFGGMREAIEKARELANARYAEVEYIETRAGWRSLLEEIVGAEMKITPFLRLIF